MEITWLDPPEHPRVRRGEVDVWLVSLDLPHPGAWEILSTGERERADRFHFARDRRRFITARAHLRLLIGEYLAVPPASVRFVYSARGKPAVEPGDARLEFNMAHSAEVALYAFTEGAAIGVDVERIREGPTEEGIAERFFSPREREDLAALPLSEQRAAFFRCWTRKEAFIKAIGEGLAFGLSQFSVSLLLGEPARLRETAHDPAEAAGWTLLALDPGEGYVGALAVRGPVAAARFYRAQQEPADTSATGE